MEVVILKSMSNKKFVSKKHENYFTLSWLTKRLWISKEIPVVSDGSVVYNLKFNSGLSVEGRICLFFRTSETRSCAAQK